MLTNAAPNYKPNLPYTLVVRYFYLFFGLIFQSAKCLLFKIILCLLSQASVQRFDGTPVVDGSDEILVRLSTNYYDDENVTETRHTIDSNGLLYYSLVVPHSRGFTLKFIYMDAEEKLGWIPAIHSHNHAYIKATLKTEK